MSDDSNRDKLDAIKVVYNSIRTQSLAAKEQRFRLYYWKALALFALFGWYITMYLPNEPEAPGHGVAVFVAIAIVALAVLFDTSICSRSVAIKRDGRLLKGLENAMSEIVLLRPEVFPETFYEKMSPDACYEDRTNRRLEIVAQMLLSLFSISGAVWVAWTCLSYIASPLPLAQTATIAPAVVFGFIDTQIWFPGWIRKCLFARIRGRQTRKKGCRLVEPD